jgi:hypothetical protein
MRKKIRKGMAGEQLMVYFEKVILKSRGRVKETEIYPKKDRAKGYVYNLLIER